MNPIIVQLEEKRIIGVQTRTTNAYEFANMGEGKIPQLWGRFYGQHCMELVQDKVYNELVEVYGVYNQYESDHNGAYSLLVGVEVNSTASQPPMLTSAIIQAGNYLKFSATGPMPMACIQLWQLIWEYFKTARDYRWVYTTAFEVYYPKNNPNQVDIFIAVKEC